MKNSILIISFFLVSCRSNNKETVTKLVYISGINICYDSLSKPQLSLRKYFEYSYSNAFKIAKGDNYNNYDSGYLRFEKAPPFGLNEFYSLGHSDSIVEKINTTFINKVYDSSYKSNETEGWHFSYLIYETNQGRKRIIEFDKDTIPEDLESLYYMIERLILSKRLTKTASFKIDTCVNNLQINLFQKYPPPPPPSKMNQDVKYSTQAILDTISKE